MASAVGGESELYLLVRRCGWVDLCEWVDLLAFVSLFPTQPPLSCHCFHLLATADIR